MRNKTRINIGRAFERWRQLRELKGFKSDSDLAFFLLDTVDRVCGEHLSQDQSSASPRKRGRPRKSTAAPQTEPSSDAYSTDQCHASEDPHSTDHSQPSSDSQSDTESQPSPDPQPTNVEVLGIHHDLPSHWPYKPDKQAQPERQNDGSDLDVVIGSIAPSYSFARHSSSSSTTTEEDNAMNWEEIKDELAETAQRLEERLNVMRSLTDGALEPISMTIGKDDQKEVKWVVNKSSLTGLFRNCHQCGEPVLEFKTLTSGSLVRIQWECSKGHLMWLFPNNPT
ncbi:uncharacterized protein si:ch211-40k21.5 isoform X2 [Rhinichthys klamathensis goyatoka]|uniref:uncharacterized protein si:ch211-40k21.5 isoform X2 n=1 Tax=Rhinichthys klamathensis goyatoka TaxID=3034132 RepID=UPI0024B5DA8B|nr:uncharacterized protein si:ch211-40k21.5 isoform X2 [Rhinichthys klamathensis goyatoka]